MISAESPSSKCTKVSPRFRREIRLTETEYKDLNLRASTNRMTISEYIRFMIFKDKEIKINTEYDLFMEIKRFHADLNKLGNYLVHVTSVIEDAEAYINKEELSITIMKLRMKAEEAEEQIKKLIRRN